MVNLLVATTYVQGTREVDRRLRLQPRTDCADRTTVVSLSLSLTSHLSLLHSIIVYTGGSLPPLAARFVGIRLDSKAIAFLVNVKCLFRFRSATVPCAQVQALSLRG